MPTLIADHILFLLAGLASVALVVIALGLRRMLRLSKVFKQERTLRSAASLLGTTVTTVIFVGIGFVSISGLVAIGPATRAMNGLHGKPAPSLTWQAVIPPTDSVPKDTEAPSDDTEAQDTEAQDTEAQDTEAQDTEAQDTEAQDTAPTQPRIEDFRGQVVLVNLWATWCPPCVGEMPDLDRLQKEYGERGLRIVNISDEDEDTILKYLAENPMSTTHGRVEAFPWPNAGRPTTYLLDRQGIVRKSALGAREYEVFEDMIKAYL